VCCCCEPAFFCPGLFSLPPIDPRRSALWPNLAPRCGQRPLIDIRVQKAALKKPVGLSLDGRQAWSPRKKPRHGSAESLICLYRLPSLLGAVFIRAAHPASDWRKLLGAREGFTRAPHSLLRVAEYRSRIAEDDAMLLACISGLHASSHQPMWRGLPKRSSLKTSSSSGSRGIGFLIKGPVILLPFLGAHSFCSAREILRGSSRCRPRWVPLALSSPVRVSSPFPAIGRRVLKNPHGKIYWQNLAGTKLGGLPPDITPSPHGACLARLGFPLWLFATMAWKNRDDQSHFLSPGRCRFAGVEL